MVSIQSPIPRAADVDYSDTEAAYGYYLILGRHFSRVGLLGSSRFGSSLMRVLKGETNHWLGEVKRQLTTGSVSAVTELLDPYCMMHTVSKGCRDTAFSNKIRVSTVNRWLAGEKAITGTQMVRLLWPLVSSDPTGIDRKFSIFCSKKLRAWITELSDCGRFQGISDCEAYQRLAHILSHDLFAYLPGGGIDERSVKLKWAAAYRLKDVTALDTDTLKEYINFEKVYSLLKSNHTEDTDVGRHLITELSTRPDLHPLYRQALRLTLTDTPSLPGPSQTH